MINRKVADRAHLLFRYPSDLSDAEWVLVAPMIPPARRGGRHRSVDVREVLNAIFYVLSTGCELCGILGDEIDQAAW
ncbi:transposase [Nitrobacter winogradskyi]|uniref:Transposase n=1 Tax=Nitrobacter winogradskyi TaxID=913 RepID=A0ACC6ANF5_NITWI|nr:transposase [Nitrobacter winogradskyi]